MSVDGFLVRTGSPDSAQVGVDYYFLFGDSTFANDAVAAGGVDFSTLPVPLVVRVRGDLLPVEAFARPPAGSTEPVAIPFVFRGARSLMTLLPSSMIAQSIGLPAEREVVLLTAATPPLSRKAGTVSAVIAALLLWWGVRLFRSWRRGRRPHVAGDAQAGVAAAASNSVSQPWDSIHSRGPGGSAPKVARGIGLPRLPWGKVAGVLVVLGIIGARVGRKAAPALDNVARTGAHVVDDAASARRAIELPSAGDVALDVVGQAPNIKTVVEAVKAPVVSRRELSRGPESFSATVTGFESTENYELLPSTGGAKDRLVFELTRTKSVEEVNGRLAGRGAIVAKQTSRDLPDASAGEFTRIELTPDGDGVRLVQEFALALDGGYVEVLRATGRMRFVGGGSWEALLAAQDSAVLEFTQAGNAEFAGGLEAALGRAAEASMVEQGLGEMAVTARYDQAPVQELLLEGGKAILRQRGVTVLKLSGRS